MNNLSLNEAEKSILGHAAQDLVDRLPEDVDRVAKAREVCAQPGFLAKLGIIDTKHDLARDFFVTFALNATVDTDKMFDGVCNLLLGERIQLDICLKSTAEVFIGANRKITKAQLRKLVQQRHDIDLDPSPLRSQLQKVLKVSCCWE